MRGKSSVRRMVWGVVAILVAAFAAQAAEKKPAIDTKVTQGSLRVQMKDGSIVSCPLKHTDVKAKISGFIARVKVTQTFYNPLDEKIEAVYVFPLPHEAAVDDMTMVIGERRIVGLIKRRAAARAIYELALRRGQTAALLEQERPNIFTQSVGNIKPKQEVRIEISYVDVLKYDMGVYDFHFPMVVGPRFIPGSPTSKRPPLPPELRGKVGTGPGPATDKEPKGTGWAPDTDRVPDASRITPPVLKPGFRNGHDISLSVELEAGVPIQDLKVTQHKATINRAGKSGASVTLDPADSVPNKDFILRYGVVGQKPELAVLAHALPGSGGYFMLMIQPKEDERLKKTPPRELFFLVDVSGSMRGHPMAQVRRTMKKFLEKSKAGDTFQVVTFAGRAREVFDKPQLIHDASLTKALEAVGGMRGGGGTYMLKGIVKCLDAPADPKRVRIVIMLTDGYIGNEKEIIGEVGRRCGDRIRFWTLGVGTSVNRYLIDGVAKQGGGMSKILGLKEDPEKLVQEVMFRIHRAQLAEIQIDWGGLAVYETYPAKVPELWAGRPVILFGRHHTGGEATIKVNGRIEGEPASFPVAVELPEDHPEHEVLAKVWARKKIEELMAQNAIEESADVVEEITLIALDYRLMSQYTSFVAVDRSEVGQLKGPARPPRRMLVPVPLPEGVSFEGIFGPGEMDDGGVSLGKGELRRKAGPEEITALRPSVRHMALPVRAPMAPPAVPAPARPGPMAGEAPGRTFTAPQSLSFARGRRTGYGGFAPGFRADEFAEDEKADLGEGRWAAGGAYHSQILAGQAEKRAEEAKQALEAGKALAKKGQLVAAQAQFQLAYLLDAIAMSYRRSDGQTAAAALAEIAKLTEKVKFLEKRLNLVIRNQSLEQALALIQREVAAKISVLPGSLDDAKALLQRDRLQVTYLDLRNATLRQALDWMLHPLRLSWVVKDDGVVVGSTRQMGGPWVYDVSLLALPEAKLFEKKNRQERNKIAQQAADDFLAAIKEVAPSAVWYAPGQVLVFSEKKVHEAVAARLKALADPKVEEALAGAAGKVHAATSARYAARKEPHAKWLAAVGRIRVARMMAAHSWGLLAAALKGQVDLERLTELQAAWADPRAKQLLERGSLAAVRSLWLIQQSQRARPKNKELADLADKSFQASTKVTDTILAKLAEKEDAVRFVKALYVALAERRSDLLLSKSAAKGLNALTTLKPGKDPLGHLRLLARALLSPVREVDAKAVQGVLVQKLQGDDLIVLGALAARRLGGETWRRFRAEAREILGRQRLSGSVIVLVNRLAAIRRPMLARR